MVFDLLNNRRRLLIIKRCGYEQRSAAFFHRRWNAARKEQTLGWLPAERGNRLRSVDEEKGGIVLLDEMRLVVSVGSKSLLAQLRSEGLESKPLQECGVSLVFLAPIAGRCSVHDKETVYPIPATLAKFRRASLDNIIRLYGAEQGGGLSSFSAVVCGASGRAVKPFYKVSELSAEFSEIQAAFLLHGSGVFLSVSNGTVRVCRHYVVFQNGFIVLTTQKWRIGRRLPRPLLGFEKAIGALKQKSESPSVGIFYADGVRKPGRVSEVQVKEPVIV